MLKKLIDKIISRLHNRHLEKLEKEHGLQLPADKYHAEGVKHYEAGRYNESMKLFKKEIEHDIHGHIGYKWMGKAMLRVGNRYGAEWHYEMAIANAQRMHERYPDPYDFVVINSLRKELKEIKKGADTV